MSTKLSKTASYLWECPYLPVHSTTLMWLPRLNKRGDWGRQQDKIWHWTKDENGVAAQSWFSVEVELWPDSSDS